jgi:hypothetical protein
MSWLSALAAPTGAVAGPILAFFPGPDLTDRFGLTIVLGPINGDDRHDFGFVPGAPAPPIALPFTFWTVGLTIMEFDRLNDQVRVHVSARHTAGLNVPHPGDAASGPIYSHTLFVDADNKSGLGFPPGLLGVLDADAQDLVHPNTLDPNHIDRFVSLLQSGVVPHPLIPFRDDIVATTVRVEAVHLIPEPATLTLVAIGTFGLLRYRRRW